MKVAELARSRADLSSEMSPVMRSPTMFCSHVVTHSGLGIAHRRDTKFINARGRWTGRKEH